MKRKEILNRLDYLCYWLLINAVVFFIIFEYSGSILMQNISLALFALFSVLLIVFETLKLIDIEKEDEKANKKINGKAIVLSTVKIVFALVILAFSALIFFGIKII